MFLSFLRTDDQRDYDSPNLLLAVLPPGSARAPPRSAGAWGEAKGVATCDGSPHLLAVPTGDQYLRLYDRRMLAPGQHGSLLGSALQCHCVRREGSGACGCLWAAARSARGAAGWVGQWGERAARQAALLGHSHGRDDRRLLPAGWLAGGPPLGVGP